MTARLFAGLFFAYLFVKVLALDAAGQRGHIPPGLADKFLKGSNAGVNMHYFFYQFYTPDTLAFPLSKSFPQYSGNNAAFELAIYLQRYRASHRLYGLVSLPAYLAGVDSLGGSLIMDTYGSYYQHLGVGYQLKLPLLTAGIIQLYYGAEISVRHQKTSLAFLPAGKYNKRELIAGLGPGISAEVELLPNLFLQAGTFVLLYTPHTSAGRLIEHADNNNHIDQPYRPVIIAISSLANISYDVGEKWQAKLGYTHIYAQGLGGVEQTFRPKQPVAFTHELIQGVNAGIVYTIPPRWTRRKLEHPCPLSR